MRRLLPGLVVAVLLANVAAITTGAAKEPTRIVAAELPGEAPATTTTTTSSTTTTTTAAAATTHQRPVDAPKNPYQPEPHVVLGTIQIPKLGLDVPLNEGISLTSIDRGPSHWPGTAMPGGSSGNVVVAGHRVTHTRPFRHIDTLVPGDQIVFVVDGVRSTYEVTGHDVVTPKQTEIVMPTAEPTVTLFACHPPGSARYRYVIHGKLIATAPA
jgi:sortase A